MKALRDLKREKRRVSNGLPRLTDLHPVAKLDYLIVASLLVIPQCFFAGYPTSLMSFTLQKWLLYSTPGLLIAVKTILAPAPIRAVLIRRSIKYFVFVLYGVGLALFHTKSPRGVINSYGAVLLFMGYVLAYLSQSHEGSLYHINLIRLFYVHVAFLGLVHYVAWGFLGIRETLFYSYAYSAATDPVPFSGLTQVFSASPWYPGGVPRYSFLFLEPRVLGSQIPVALLLQMGFVRYAAQSGSLHRRWWSRFEFAALLASMFVIHSATGYIILAAAACFLFLLWLFGATARTLGRTVATCFATYCAIGVVAFALFFTPGTFSDELDRRIHADVGSVADYLAKSDNILGRKDPGVALGYSKAIATYPFNLFYFPLGSGWLQPGDQPVYDRYGITVTGGFSFVGALIVHAGFLGLAFFVYVAGRAVKALRGVRWRDRVLVKWFAIAVVFTFLAGLMMDISGLSARLFLELFLIELIIIENGRMRMRQSAASARAA